MLAGCQAKPIVKTDIVYVNKEVIIPCIKEVPIQPSFTVPALNSNSEPYEKIIALRTDLLLYQKYTKELEAVLEACK